MRALKERGVAAASVVGRFTLPGTGRIRVTV